MHAVTGGRRPPLPSKGTTMPSTATDPARRPRPFADRSVRTKVLSALGALAVVSVGVSTASLVALSQASERTDVLFSDTVLGLQALGRLHLVEIMTMMLVAQHSVTPDAECKSV